MVSNQKVEPLYTTATIQQQEYNKNIVKGTIKFYKSGPWDLEQNKIQAVIHSAKSSLIQ